MAISSSQSNPTNTPFPTADTQSGSAASGAASGVDVERLRQGAHNAVDRIADKVAPAAEKLRSGVSDAATSLQGHADELSALQKEWTEAARTCVRDHPLVAVGAAVAFGMLLARLTR